MSCSAVSLIKILTKRRQVHACNPCEYGVINHIHIVLLIFFINLNLFFSDGAFVCGMALIPLEQTMNGRLENTGLITGKRCFSLSIL